MLNRQFAGFAFAMLLMQQAIAQPIYLWEARQGDTIVYLYGSIHLCSSKCFPLPAAVDDAMAGSAALAVELDPLDEKAISTLVQRAFYAPGDAVGQHLPKDIANRYLRALVERGVPQAAAKQMKPWFGTTMIEIIDAQRDGFSAEQGVDLHLVKQARAQGKAVVELETVEEQVSALESMSADDEAGATRQFLDMADTGRTTTYLREMVAAWRDGDAARLYARSLAAFPDAKAGERAMAALLDARNRVMARRIAAEAVKRKPLFVVIGAAHLAGTASLQVQLEAAGFSVRQISDPP
ncbi:MAG: TraB/GumN family protein [Sterolibacteriaceae bacterium]|nr:TraB/GumN family protein [Candidatus Methylophosphatis haderslevensis]